METMGKGRERMGKRKGNDEDNTNLLILGTVKSLILLGNVKKSTSVGTL